AQVLAVLLVDALDVLRDHELDPRAHLGIGRLLAGGSLPAPLAAHRGDEPAAFYRSAADRELLAALEPQVGEIAQRLVVVVTDVGRSDFIGGDVVPQRDPGTPREVLALELTTHQVGIHREEQHPSGKPYAVGPLLDAPGAQPLQHERKMTPCRRWIKRIFFRPHHEDRTRCAASLSSPPRPPPAPPRRR